MDRLGNLIMRQLDALYVLREQYPVARLEGLRGSLFCLQGWEELRIVTDCNSAFNLGGYTFYPHLCDGRPKLAEAMAKSVCFWLNLFGGVPGETVQMRRVRDHSQMAGGAGSRGW